MSELAVRLRNWQGLKNNCIFLIQANGCLLPKAGCRTQSATCNRFHYNIFWWIKVFLICCSLIEILYLSPYIFLTFEMKRYSDPTYLRFLRCWFHWIGRIIFWCKRCFWYLMLFSYWEEMLHLIWIGPLQNVYNRLLSLSLPHLWNEKVHPTYL